MFEVTLIDGPFNGKVLSIDETYAYRIVIPVLDAPELRPSPLTHPRDITFKVAQYYPNGNFAWCDSENDWWILNKKH